MLLYKTLEATKYEKKNGEEDVCSLSAKVECNHDEDINCTHIDLLSKSSDCQTCVQGDWKAIKPCYLHYEKKKFKIDDEKQGIHIDIDGNNHANGTIINKDAPFKASKDCHCVWSRYNYKKINGNSELINDGNNQLLFCKCEKQQNFHEKYYCLKDDSKDVSKGDSGKGDNGKGDNGKGDSEDDNKGDSTRRKKENNEVVNNKEVAVCYEKSGTCYVTDDANVSCTTTPHQPDKGSYTVIMDRLCQPLKNLSCEIIKISVTDENIKFTEVGHEWTNVNATVNCTNVTEPCTVDFNQMCNSDNTQICDNDAAPTTSTTLATIPDDAESESNSSAPFLIIIIIILVVLLVSYCGYQNQWHHKVTMLPTYVLP